MVAMDVQEWLDTMMQIRRDAVMENSEQLTLGELIAKLEAIEDKSKPVIFDAKYHPEYIDSWRGSYAELALNYEESDKRLSVSDLLQKLKGAIGDTFEGYKGGEFVMDRSTPVWVANYGYSMGFKQDEDIDSQAVVGVSQDERNVTIETRCIAY